MDKLKQYKASINELIALDQDKPQKVTLQNPQARMRRAGITPHAMHFKELYNLLLEETSIQEQVELAYKLILKRPADLEGSLRHQELVKNHGITALVTHLRYSQEGQAKKTTIKGLLRPYIKQKLRHWLAIPR